jgi:hypothetical protein
MPLGSGSQSQSAKQLEVTSATLWIDLSAYDRSDRNTSRRSFLIRIADGKPDKSAPTSALSTDGAAVWTNPTVSRFSWDGPG